MNDTIVALATPAGRSGIGVIRLSGPQSVAIAKRLTRDNSFTPKPRFSHLRSIFELENGELLDEVVITYFQSPKSFTGEDVVEIACHGSPVVLRRVIDAALKLDARLAEPGEFSLRALASGRMNLSQAEAVRDLIDAQSVAAARQSVRQLRGELSNELQPIKDALLDVIVILESTLEFVEDDLPDFQNEKIRSRLVNLGDEVERMAATFQAGRLLREGITVALVGRPNVGKSSLFNALLGRDRAIVTDIAGTTRDQLHEKLVVKNIPIALVDTAGLRETTDTVESIGVERSRRTMADADLVVVLLDGSQPLTFEDREILDSTNEFARLVVVNKLDLGLADDFEKLDSPVVSLSAKTGANLDEFRDKLVEPFHPQDIEQSGLLISDARHHDLLVRARAEIETAIACLDQRMSEEITLIGLHNALRYLGQITGETTTEDMLTRIFSTFCIGK